MRRLQPLALGLLLALGATAAAQQETVFKGKIVDAAGKPAVGVEVASLWLMDPGTVTPHKGATTDADGKFSVEVPGWMANAALLALTKDRKSAAIIEVKKADAGQEYALTLSQAVTVTGNFDCTESGKKPTWTNVYLMTPNKSRVLQSTSKKAEFAFVVPAGKYKFWGYGTDVKSDKRELEVKADKPVLDLKTIDLPATVIAKHTGKAPPAWHVTDARGAKKDVTLADYKGKWVLIEFWGFW